jgi:flagellar basal body-associated protein FliL
LAAAKDNSKDAKAAAAKPPEGGGRSPAILIGIIGAVLGIALGAGIGIVAYGMLGGGGGEVEGGEAHPAAEGGGHEGAPAEGAPAEGAAHGAEGGAEAGAHGEPKSGDRSIISLGQFTVNLRGTGGGRVLRAEVKIECDSVYARDIEIHKPQLRDAVLTLASDYTYADIEGLDGKTSLRDELLERLNSLLKGDNAGRIERIYFTEFVVQ